MEINDLVVLLLLLAGAAISKFTGKLTTAGAITGAVVGFLIFKAAGYTGICMLACFFVLGTLATSWKINVKESAGLAETNKGRRTAGQVFANGGVAAIAGLLAWTVPAYADVFRLLIAASLASATADTLSSELGNYYGRKFYNIITLKKDVRGLNGVVSLEGTLIGVGGSAIIAIIYAIGFGWRIAVLYVVIGGTIGNLSDSILGATLERKHQLNNNAVNFLNTLIGALTVALLN